MFKRSFTETYYKGNWLANCKQILTKYFQKKIYVNHR